VAKLTKRVVDAAESRASDYFIWDGDLPGFGVRVLPSGRKGYIVQYRAGKRSRRMSLGLNTVITCEQARTRAMHIMAHARSGEDPAVKRDANRRAITVRELADRFDKEHVAVRVKESTAKGYRRMLQRVIIPALGSHRQNPSRPSARALRRQSLHRDHFEDVQSRGCVACARTVRIRENTSRSTRRRSGSDF
jgi:hypothetical protein